MGEARRRRLVGNVAIWKTQVGAVEEVIRDNSYRLKDKLKAGLVRPAEATE